MTPTEAWVLMIGLYVFLAFEIVAVLYWMNRNNALLRITENTDGAKMLKSVRCREVIIKGYLFSDGIVRPKLHYTGHFAWDKAVKEWENSQAKPVEVRRFYWLWDVFKRKPYNVNNAHANEMPSIGMPLIGIKRVILVSKEGDAYNAYSISQDIPKEARISLNMMSWIAERRLELYEETKHIDTKAELYAKIVIPIGMIILALACIIFFPKIYTALMTQGNAAADSVGTSLAQAIKDLTPLG